MHLSRSRWIPVALGSLSLALLGFVRADEEDESWTVLYYGMADTNLEPDMLDDVGEMGKVGSQEGLDIVALVDRSPGYSDQPVLGLDDWVGAKVLKIGEDRAEVIEDLGPINMGDPAVLADFVTKGFRDHPADHTALVFSDHGASWPGLGPDDSAQDSLTLPELTQGVARGLAGAQVDKLDLVGFDACLMGTYEVADKVAPLAHRMIASEELEPGHGWDYRALEILADAAPADADDLGRAIVNGYEGQAEEQETEASITLAFLDLDEMDELRAAIGDLSTALSANVGEIAPHVGRDRAEALRFARVPDPTQDPHMVDLGDLVDDIGGGVDEIEDRAETVRNRLDDVVMNEVEGESQADATGLSIYFPPYADFYDDRYVEATGVTEWSRFLDSYYATGAAVSVPPRFVDDALRVEADAGGVEFSGTLDADSEKSFAEAFVYVGVVEDDGTVTTIGEVEAARQRGDEDELIGEFDYTVLTLGDGTTTMPAFLGVGEGQGALTVTVPLEYRSPGGGEPQDIFLRFLADPASGEVGGESYFVYDEAAQTFGELTAEAGGTIVAKFPNIAADGTETWLVGDQAVAADLENLELDFERLDPGTDLELKLSVRDFAGNDATLTGRSTVPESAGES